MIVSELICRLSTMPADEEVRIPTFVGHTEHSKASGTDLWSEAVTVCEVEVEDGKKVVVIDHTE